MPWCWHWPQCAGHAAVLQELGSSHHVTVRQPCVTQHWIVDSVSVTKGGNSVYTWPSSKQMTTNRFCHSLAHYWPATVHLYTIFSSFLADKNNNNFKQTCPKHIHYQNRFFRLFYVIDHYLPISKYKLQLKTKWTSSWASKPCSGKCWCRGSWRHVIR